MRLLAFLTPSMPSSLPFWDLAVGCGDEDAECGLVAESGVKWLKFPELDEAGDTSKNKDNQKNYTRHDSQLYMYEHVPSLLSFSLPTR